MATVILKTEKRSKKFNVTFPKNVELNYSESLKCVEHPKIKNIWISVSSKDFKTV